MVHSKTRRSEGRHAPGNFHEELVDARSEGKPVSTNTFEIRSRDQESKARCGRLTTNQAVIETPVFMPTGTQRAVKAVRPEEQTDLQAQIILGEHVSPIR